MSEIITPPPSPELQQFEAATSPQSQETVLAPTVKIMERLHASEICATPGQTKDFLNELNYDEFKRWLSMVNGLERGIPAPQRDQVSDSFVHGEGALIGNTVEYRPPHSSLRDGLLKMAFEKAQSLEDPALAGLTLGLAINAIHYYADGNGRTGRLAYALLAKGYDGSAEDQQYYTAVLENGNGRDVINPNPSVSGIDQRIRAEMAATIRDRRGYTEALGDKIPTYLWDAYPNVFVGEESPQALAVSQEITTEGRLKLDRTIRDGDVGVMSLMATFGPERVKEYVRTSSDGERTFIDAAAFLPTLSEEDINKWWQASEMARKEYVKRLINVADRPDITAIAACYAADSRQAAA